MSSKSPPRANVWVEERTPRHVVGVYDDLVITVAFDGSQQDRQHLDSTVRVVEEHATRLGKTVEWLFVLPDAHRTGAPSAEVRDAAQKGIQRARPHVGRAAVVMVGEGFGVAIHRAVVSSLMLALRASSRMKAFADVPPALAFLLADEPARRERVLRFYEQDLLHPTSRSSAPPARV